MREFRYIDSIIFSPIFIVIIANTNSLIYFLSSFLFKGLLLSSNGSKTMLDSSNSNKKTEILSTGISSTPAIGVPMFSNQANQFKNTGVTSSIASSIQDSLNQLSLSTTSSQMNTNNLASQTIEYSDVGLPTEPIKINLPTSKQTSDYNSDTSSSNEWNQMDSNTWSISLENSNNRPKLTNENDNSKFVCPKPVNGKFKTPFSVQPNTNLTLMNKNDKYTSTPTASASSTLIRSTANSRQQNKTNSTLQEDLLRLINPNLDSYLPSPLSDNGDNTSENNLNSSNPSTSNESSNTQYSTPYSSLERSNTSCSNKDSGINNQISTNEEKKESVLVAQPAIVSNYQLNPQLDKKSIDHFNRQQSKLDKFDHKSSSMDYLCKIDKIKDDKKTQSVTKSKKFSFDSSSTGIDQDWPSLVSNANKVLEVTQQANSLATTSLTNKKSLFKNELQQINKSSSLKESEDNASSSTCASPATIATAKLNQHRNSLDQWIKEFENFSKNASTLFNVGGDSSKRFSTGENSTDQVEDDCFQQASRNQLEPSQLDAEKVKSLEERLKQLQTDLVKEQSSKLTLEEQVKHLEEENRRLHNESISAAQQLRDFTTWFFSNINAK